MKKLVDITYEFNGAHKYTAKLYIDGSDSGKVLKAESDVKLTEDQLMRYFVESGYDNLSVIHGKL